MVRRRGSTDEDSPLILSPGYPLARSCSRVPLRGCSVQWQLADVLGSVVAARRPVGECSAFMSWMGVFDPRGPWTGEIRAY